MAKKSKITSDQVLIVCLICILIIYVSSVVITKSFNKGYEKGYSAGEDRFEELADIVREHPEICLLIQSKDTCHINATSYGIEECSYEIINKCPMGIEFEVSLEPEELQSREIEIYCTTKEHDEFLTTTWKGCGIAEDYNYEHGGLVKIKGHWINIHWLEKMEVA